MKYFRIYKTFLAQYFKVLMEYRFDFFIGLFSFFIIQSTSILFLYLVFQRIPALNGWSYNQILFIYGFAQIPRGIDHLFTDNLWLLARNIIKDGSFDRYLLRPLSPLFQVLSERFQTDAFGELILGIGLFTYGYQQLGLHFTAFEWLKYGVVVIAGVFIYTSIKMICASVAFWTKKSMSLLFVTYQLADFTNYPIDVYNGFIKNLLTFVVPFAFVSFIPASEFLGKAYYQHASLLAILVASVLFAFATWLWRQGLKVYESAGN